MTDNTELQITDFALLAVFYHSGRIAHGNPVANGRRIVAQVLVWQDNWSADARRALYEDKRHPEADKIYSALISMCRSPSDTVLIVGHGVIGEDIDSSADLAYVAFTLTESGRSRVDYLLSKVDDLSPFEMIPSV